MTVDGNSTSELKAIGRYSQEDGFEFDIMVEYIEFNPDNFMEDLANIV